MRVLYGVQATGNGHITRARVMAPELEKAGVKVDYLFSGREPENLFNMEPFGEYRCRRGLTFYMQGSRVSRWQTLTKNSVVRLIRDVKGLDLSAYDLVITDFEPVSAWAAKLQGVKCVGLAHQYAFLHELPDTKSDRFFKAQVKLFAPADIPIGLHWSHFDQAIFPPLIQPAANQSTLIPRKVVVYLPHDGLERIQPIFKRCPDIDFHIYAAIDRPEADGNCHIKPFSRAGFQKDLAECEGVICNAGFGLLSEALQYGKKIMTIPQQGQVEQESNAEILQILNLGTVVTVLESNQVTAWLEQSSPQLLPIPNMASLFSGWIASGCKASIESLLGKAWSK